LKSLVSSKLSESGGEVFATVRKKSFHAQVHDGQELAFDSWRIYVVADGHDEAPNFLEVSVDRTFDTLAEAITNLRTIMKALPETVSEVQRWDEGNRQLPHLSRHGVSEHWILDVAVGNSKPHTVVLTFRPTVAPWQRVEETEGPGKELTLIWPAMELVRVPTQETTYFQKTEVTKRQWFAVMGTEPWKPFERKGKLREGGYFKELGYFGPDSPATGMTGKSASKFCQRLTLRQRQLGTLAENFTVALPGADQWKAAALAGRTVEKAKLDALKSEQYGAPRRNGPFKVASKAPNPWGLFDMLGNISEYCVNGKQQPRVSCGGTWAVEKPLMNQIQVLDALGSRVGGFRIVVIETPKKPRGVNVP
jgi:hypothetical protein